MGMELDDEIGIPCVVQRCMLWFSAPTRLNQTLGRDLKTQKVPRSREQGNCRSDLWTLRVYAHTENVHVGIGGHGLAQNTQKVRSEQGDGRMGDGR